MIPPEHLQRIKRIASSMSLTEGQVAHLLRMLEEEATGSDGEVYSDTVMNEKPRSGGAYTTLSMDDTTIPPPPRRVRGGFGYGFALPPHLEDGGLLTVGGMGEIRRVYDKNLRRHLILKVLRMDLKRETASIARFVNEAQVTAQLEHPGIVPVHELGKLRDGRPFFTMREIRGRTLEEVLSEVHAASTLQYWGTASSGWTFRKLILAFRQVCEAVSYAHSRGVVHRDLKPANILVGEYGVVQVVDWGLAKVLGQKDVVRSPGGLVQTDRSESGSHTTQVGVVAGTVAYMPPEQAKGQMDTLDATADVYSLGAILYEILCGCPPYDGRDWDSVWNKVITGPPPEILRVRQRSAPPIPEELALLCEKAMERNTADRFSDARVLVNRLVAWMDGEERRDRALEVIEQAQALLPRVTQLQSDASRLSKTAEARLGQIPKWASIDEKKPAWELQDRARALEEEAGLEEARFLQMAQGALTHDPDLIEARQMLAEYYRQKHQNAEEVGDRVGAAHFEALLSAQKDPGQMEYLLGEGRLSLTTNPPGARVMLYGFKPHDRRLEVVFLRALGATPIVEHRLQAGSYLLRIDAEGCDRVYYPVQIQRNEHWDGIAPGDKEPTQINLPREGDLFAEDVYVPAGWFQAGGDPNLSVPAPRQRIWVDGFVMRRHPVTNAEYLQFLNALVKSEQFELAEKYQPREWTGQKNQEGMPIYSRRSDGRFVLGKDKDGQLWLPDWPVVLVSHHAATAYAEWFAKKTQKPWRLPREYEWEKAARGVDGRLFPWGSFFDPTWANTRESGAEFMLKEVGKQDQDVSPYGVWSMAGNVMQWTSEPFVSQTPQDLNGQRLEPLESSNSERVVVRGGAWSVFHGASRSCFRMEQPVSQSTPMLGFRLLYSFQL